MSQRNYAEYRHPPRYRNTMLGGRYFTLIAWHSSQMRLLRKYYQDRTIEAGKCRRRRGNKP